MDNESMEQFKPVELEEFVEETIKQLESAAGTRYFEGGIEFEVAVTETKKVDGSLKIYVASGKGEASTERIQKIRFKILSIPPTKRLGFKSTP